MVRELLFGTFLLILVFLVITNATKFSTVTKSLTEAYTGGVGAFIGKQ